jgi:hypothetical protein
MEGHDEVTSGGVAAFEHDEGLGRSRRSPRLTIVTDSELGTFRSCPQLHHFKYREKLAPLLDAKALAIGSIFHHGMRDGIRAGWAPGTASMPTSQRVAGQIAAATASIDDLVNTWAGNLLQHGTSLDFERLAEEVDETAAMVKWMLTPYFKQSAADLTNLVLVGAERPFQVVMNDRRGRPVGHLRYTGVQDAVYYDPGYNQLVLDEHKTTGGDPRVLEKRVEMDTQAAGYLHALREEMQLAVPLAAGGKIIPRDAGIGRVRYNGLRKAYPKAPSVNQDGKVSVAATTTTVEMYRAALDAQVTERKIAVTQKQQEFLERLSSEGDKFFARVEWHRSDADIERWRRDTFYDAKRIREADRDEDARTRNTGHCNMPWSLPCSFRALCLDPTAPELRKNYKTRGDVHAEVRDAEVDAAV